MISPPSFDIDYVPVKGRSGVFGPERFHLRRTAVTQDYRRFTPKPLGS